MRTAAKLIWLFGGRSSPAGIEFIDENGGGPGVRLRKRQQVEAARLIGQPPTRLRFLQTSETA